MDEWFAIYKSESRKSRTGMHSSLFSHYISVGHKKTNFHAEIWAISKSKTIIKSQI